MESIQLLSDPSPHPDGCGRSTPQFGYEFEPHLAVHPRDPDRLIATWQQDRHTNRGALSHVLKFSRDGGETWTPREVPTITTCPRPGSRGVTDPWSSFGADPFVFSAAAVMSEAGAPEEIVVATSRDGGTSFDTVRPLIDPDNYAVHFPDKELVSADPWLPGSAYAMWVRVSFQAPEAIPSTLQFSSTTDGRNWSEERTVYSQPAGTHFGPGLNELVVLPGGVLIAVYYKTGDGDYAAERDGGPAARDSTVEVIRSDDYGATWSQPIIIAEHGYLDGDDPEGNRILGGFLPAAVRAPDGTVHVVWPDMRDRMHGAIRLASSRDQGRTWSEPRTVVENDNHPTTPGVAVARDGTIGVLYNDFTSDRPGDERIDLDAWYAVSGDQGETWSRRRLGEVSDSAQGPPQLRLGDYYGTVGIGRDFGAVFIATPPVATDGLSDVFFARIGVRRPRLRLAVTPRRVSTGRDRFRFSVSTAAVGRSPAGAAARGQPIPGATVAFCGRSAQTGSRGRAWIACRLEPGRYRARATKAGYRGRRARVIVRRG